MFNGVLQPTHLILLFAVALLVLGPKRLPEVGRSLGHGLREFKDSIAGTHEDNAAPTQVVAAHHEETPPG
jgi:sec-independent protein translocase protein TatA